MHQMILRQKGKEGTAQPLPPVDAIAAYDGLDVVLIDKGIAAADSVAVGAVLIGTGNTDLIFKQDPGIRDHGREKKRMCSAALGALHTADPDGEITFGRADMTAVVAVDGKASMAAAGAGEAVKLEGIDDGIVRILG